MLEFQEKRKVKKFLYSKITIVILIVIIGLLLNAVWSVYKKREITQDNLEKTAANYDNLQAREATLSADINRLKTDNGVEEEIREKYGLVKPGEEVIVVVDKGDANTDANVKTDDRTFWQKVWNWLQ